MSVDVHQHLWTPSLVDALRRRTRPPFLDGWTLVLDGEPPYEADPADHDVEILADRGIARRVSQEDWEKVCREMEAHYRAGRFKEGSIAGIRGVGRLLEQHFPGGRADANELPDQPMLL